MAHTVVLLFEGVTETDYWAVTTGLGINRDGSGDWPAGLRSHSAGPTPNGWIVIEQWESKGAQETFVADRLRDALAASGVAAPAQVIETDTVNDRILG